MLDFIYQRPIPDFLSLSVYEFHLDSVYYSLSSLAKVLGYSTPVSLIQSIPLEYKVSFDEFYSFYTLYLDQFQTYLPLSKKQVKEELSEFKPLWFTKVEGIEYILSKNTFTIPKLKQSIAKMIGITPIAPPHKESTFYEVLCSMLKDSGLVLNRHLYLAGYYADIEIQGISPAIIVEFDENKHRYYNKEKELKREQVFKSLGYNIIRVDDSISPIESATKVFRQILPLIH